MATSTAIPSKDKVTNLKAPKSSKAREQITINTIEDDNTTTTDSNSDPDSNDQDSGFLRASNDFVGILRKSASSPALGNDFLTAHHIFGDYVRKHEIPRKVFHSSIGFVTLYLYTIGVSKDVFPIPFHISFIVIFTLDLIRLRWKYFNYLYCQVVGFLMREKEINSYNGVLWYILGLDFVFSFFPKDICLSSVLLLSWSDTAASTIGRAYGKYTPKIARNKSLAGSLAAFAIGVLSSYLLYGYFVPHFEHLNDVGDIYWTPESSYLNLHTMSILAGFVAALSEGIDLFNWDDNFTIPTFSSIFFYAVITVFHK